MVEVSILKDDMILSLVYQTINSINAMNFQLKIINFVTNDIPRFIAQI